MNGGGGECPEPPSLSYSVKVCNYFTELKIEKKHKIIILMNARPCFSVTAAKSVNVDQAKEIEHRIYWTSVLLRGKIRQ